MLSDPIADMLSRIRNGYLAAKQEVAMPHSKVKEEIARVLCANNYLTEFKIQKGEIKKVLVCKLKYKNKKSALKKIIRISKPSLRVYASKKKLPRVLRGVGIVIISTSAGMMTDKQARKKGLGGEIIAKVW